MSKIFLEIFNISIAASWMIAAVMLLRLIIKSKAPKWTVCLLWALVAVRLAVPFSLESQLSLVPSGETVKPEAIYTQPAVSDVPSGYHDHTPEIPEDYYEKTPEIYIQSGFEIIDKPVNDVILNAVETAPEKAENPLKRLMDIASIVWACGMGIMVVYAIVNYIILKRRISVFLPDEKGFRRSEAVGSPFILGVFRPRIYLPFGLSEETEEYVVAHERAHIKRCDHLIKPFGYALLTVYWFNPLVWIAYILLCRDIEMACDEKVVKDMDPEARKAYASALLECGIKHSAIAACPVAFGEIGVKQRVKNALNYKKPMFWVIVVAVISCIAVAVFFLTNPLSQTDTSSETSGELSREESSEPEVSEPEVSEPEVSEHEVSEPEVSEPEVSDEVSQYDEIKDVDGLFSAQRITEEKIAEYENYYRYDSGVSYHTAMLFVPEKTIYDVKVFSVSEEWVVDGEWTIDEILYETDEVSSEKPLIADIEFIDAFAINGISFKDENGGEYYYLISDSAMDGSLIINKYDYTAEESTEPEVSEPEVSEPEVSEPEISEPEFVAHRIPYAAYNFIPVLTADARKEMRGSGGEEINPGGLFVIHSKAELDKFAENCVFSEFDGYKGDFQLFTEAIDDAYFEEYSIIVHYVWSSNLLSRYTVRGVLVEEDRVSLLYDAVPHDGGSPSVAQDNFLVAEVKKTDIADYTEFGVKPNIIQAPEKEIDKSQRDMEFSVIELHESMEIFDNAYYYENTNYWMKQQLFTVTSFEQLEALKGFCRDSSSSYGFEDFIRDMLKDYFDEKAFIFVYATSSSGADILYIDSITANEGRVEINMNVCECGFTDDFYQKLFAIEIDRDIVDKSAEFIVNRSVIQEEDLPDQYKQYVY